VSRIPALDVTRGMAMILVCLSHFTWAAIETVGPSRLFEALMVVSMIASPTFVLVSGMTLGYVHSGGGAAYRRFALKLRERGLLLVTAVYLAMLPAFHFMAPGEHETYRFIPITTTIGVCLLVGPAVVARLALRSRLWLGVALIAASWLVVLGTPPSPDGSVLGIVKDALVGARDRSWWFYSFPIIPWFGAYVIGSAIGQSVFCAARAGESVTRLLLSWAAALVGAALAVELTVTLLAARAPGSTLLAQLAATVGNPLQKVPPSPAYLLTYGAAGLGMAALINVLLDRGYVRWIMRRASDLGRSSLIVFILQSYLYYLVELHWVPPRHLWLLHYAASIGLILVAARLWLAAGGNRLLRVPGFGRFHTRAARARG
jgi:uncharacterized membrane protein